MATSRAPARPAHADPYAALCPCRAVLDLLADKWSALAIGALEPGPQRFGALQRRLHRRTRGRAAALRGAPAAARVVTRTVYPAVPLHVEYALTPLGRSAAVPLAQLRAWAAAHVDQVAPAGAARAALQRATR